MKPLIVFLAFTLPSLLFAQSRSGFVMNMGNGDYYYSETTVPTVSRVEPMEPDYRKEDLKSYQQLRNMVLGDSKQLERSLRETLLDYFTMDLFDFVSEYREKGYEIMQMDYDKVVIKVPGDTYETILETNSKDGHFWKSAGLVFDDASDIQLISKYLFTNQNTDVYNMPENDFLMSYNYKDKFDEHITYYENENRSHCFSFKFKNQEKYMAGVLLEYNP